MMVGETRIGAVILTYNSVDDLPSCLDGLLPQRGVDTRIVVVDNASAPEKLSAMEAAFLDRVPEGIVVDAAQATPSLLDETRALFVRNPSNDGYSAGNNVGARLAVGAGCEAVLIVNPDVRISDPDYLVGLWSGMAGMPDCFVASSKVINMSGCDEHPLREPGFWEEVLWFRRYGPSRFRPAPYVFPPGGAAPVVARKLHGSCLLLRSSFLAASGYLDENVFLYCEEPILAARVHAAGGRMMVFPCLEALHAHVASTKGNASRRMLHFIESRRYYLRTYSGYNQAQLMTLAVSYRVLSMIHRIKASLSGS